MTQIVKNILVIGSSGSPVEIIFLLKTLQKVEFPVIYFLDNGFLSSKDKDFLKGYQGVLPFEIRFITPEACKPNFFDLIVSLSTMFRKISPRSYTAANQQLKDLEIDTRYPLFSDQNDILGCVEAVMNFQKLALNTCKEGGVIVFYPLLVPFSVFAAYENNKDFKILDTEAEVLWQGLASLNMVNWPSYSKVPLTLHVEPAPLHYNGKFVASEMFTNETRSCNEVTFDLAETAPKLTEFFSKKDLLIIPSILSNACCVKKEFHVGYPVDFKLLRRSLQLPTATITEYQVNYPSLLADPSKKRSVNNIYFGGRYFQSARGVRKILSDLDDQWYHELYGSKKGF